jgi:predicted ATPase
MRSAVSDIEATDPGPHGEQLSSFYYWLKRQHPGLFENLVYNLGKIVPGITGLDVREATEGFLELWIKERETGEFPAAMVSEGTLRLLCLLGIAATPKAPALVGYEEPENGVNPARLSEMLSILENAATSSSGTQFLITTHSPSVINFFPDAKRIYCSKGPSGSEYVVYPELPLFRDLDVEYTLGTIQTAVSRLGDQFRRGDLG